MISEYDKRGKTEELDRQQFYEHFKLLYPKLMAIACRFVDEDIARDLVQDTFVMLWEERNKIEFVPAYLYKSIRNNCLNYIKHNMIVSDYAQRVRIAESRALFLSEKSDENEIFRAIEYKDIRERIETALEKLPPRSAEAFRLYYFEELSAKEVAEVMRISHRTVEVHVQKSVAFLRTELKNSVFLLLAILLH